MDRPQALAGTTLGPPALLPLIGMDSYITLLSIFQSTQENAKICQNQHVICRPKRALTSQQQVRRHHEGPGEAKLRQQAPGWSREFADILKVDFFARSKL